MRRRCNWAPPSARTRGRYARRVWPVLSPALPRARPTAAPRPRRAGRGAAVAAPPVARARAPPDVAPRPRRRRHAVAPASPCPRRRQTIPFASKFAPTAGRRRPGSAAGEGGASPLVRAEIFPGRDSAGRLGVLRRFWSDDGGLDDLAFSPGATTRASRVTAAATSGEAPARRGGETPPIETRAATATATAAAACLKAWSASSGPAAAAFTKTARRRPGRTRTPSRARRSAACLMEAAAARIRPQDRHQHHKAPRATPRSVNRASK